MKSDNKTYRVADFYFTVENLPFYPDNFKPFVVPDCDGEKLFSLQIVDSLPQSDANLIYRTNKEPGFPTISLFGLPSGDYLFEVQPPQEKPVAATMVVSPDFKTAQLLLSGLSDFFAMNSCLMLLFTFATATKGALEMHSSVVTNGGRGYMFLGKSGTGKSTHSQLWIKNLPGTELLNDDNPVVRLLPDGTVRVYGSPWSGKTPCYKQKDAPVGAIVSLKQAPYNKITRLPVIRAYATLLESASSFRPFKHLADGWHATMEGICAAIPFYRLECLPDNDAAMLCYNTVNGKQNPA
jgi:hypothetical protein